MPTRATFVSHSVQPDGLRIEATTGRGLIPDVEVFVPREEAEQFGWVDQQQGGEDDSALQEQVDNIEELIGAVAKMLQPLKSAPGVMISNDIDYPFACVQSAFHAVKELKRALGLKQFQSEEAAQ